jgi:hypothetical protein
MKKAKAIKPNIDAFILVIILILFCKFVSGNGLVSQGYPSSQSLVHMNDVDESQFLHFRQSDSASVAGRATDEINLFIIQCFEPVVDIRQKHVMTYRSRNMRFDEHFFRSEIQDNEIRVPLMLLNDFKRLLTRDIFDSRDIRHNIGLRGSQRKFRHRISNGINRPRRQDISIRVND